MVNRFLQGTLILTIAGFVVKAIGSINWILLSRVLGGEGIGIYQMAFPVYLLALQVSSAGIPVAISIMTAEKLAHNDYRGAGRVFTLSFKLLFLSGLLFAALTYIGADLLIAYRYITDARAYDSVVALAPAVFFVTLISCFRGYLQGWQMMTPTAVSQIVEQLVRVVVMLVAAAMLLPYGLDKAAGGASLGAGFGAVAALLVLLYYYYKLPKAPIDALPFDGQEESSHAMLVRLFKLALPISLASILLPLVANLDLLIVPRRLETAGFSISEATELFGYLTGMAVPLINLATIITAALATSLVPAISDAASRDDRKGVYYRTGGAMRMTFMATVPFTVMLYILAEPVVSVIYNAPKAAAATQIMAVAIFFLGLHQVSTGILQGLGRPTIPVVNMGIAAVIKVILNWNLTALPHLGIEGAAWATVADIGFAALLNMFFIRKYTGYFLDVSVLWKNIASAAVTCLPLYLLYPALTPYMHMFLAMTLTAAVGGIVYIAMMFLLKGLDRNDAARLPIVGRYFV